MLKETVVAHGQATADLKLKDFGCFDCFLQLRIWSVSPHSNSFLVNIKNVSNLKGRALH
jgi:hypothetical protein